MRTTNNGPAAVFEAHSVVFSDSGKMKRGNAYTFRWSEIELVCDDRGFSVLRTRSGCVLHAVEPYADLVLHWRQWLEAQP
jgi:hypothetical protein